MEIPQPEMRGSTRKNYGEAAHRLRNNLTERVARFKLASRVVLIGLLISFGGVLWLNQMSTMVGIGYQMETIDQKVVLLNRQAEAMESQIAGFENLQRIENEARGRLGMVPATKFIYVRVKATQDQGDQASNNSKLYPVNDWWRELTEMLPKPWQNSAPVQK